MGGILQSLADQWGRFWFSGAALTRLGPHVRDATSVQRVWNTFVVASIPAFLIGTWSLGNQANLAIDALGLGQAPGWRGDWLDAMGIGVDPGSIADCFMHGFLWFLPIFLAALLTGAIWNGLFARIRNRDYDEGLLYTAWFLALLMPPSAGLIQVVAGMTP